jgi:hypothetical protein
MAVQSKIIILSFIEISKNIFNVISTEATFCVAKRRNLFFKDFSTPARYIGPPLEMTKCVFLNFRDCLII